uniref:GTPase-activating protein pac-1 n=1 Tax=Parascaris univalens TaxID=6257 RepID=A0A915BMZ7_PARUN
MSLCKIVLERPSPDFTYGFTIRHIAVYPPQNEMDESGTMGDDQLWEIYSAPFHTAVISRVEPLSCAAEGGLRCGDRIVSLNDEPICELSYEQICEIIRTSGTKLRVMIVTSSQTKAPSSLLGSGSEHSGAAVCSPKGHASDTNYAFTPRLRQSFFYQMPHRRVSSMYDGRFLATDSLRLNPTMRGVTTDSPSPNILSGRNDTTVPSDSADSLTRSKLNNPSGRIGALLEEMRPSSSNFVRNSHLMSPSTTLTRRPYAVEPNRIRTAVSQEDFLFLPLNPYVVSSSVVDGNRSTQNPLTSDGNRRTNDVGPRPSPNALDSKRLERFKSPPAEVKESQGGTVEGEMETKPVTVRLASPDSWMRNREIRPPVSPCVPHTFSPVWRRSALAYPEYNLPSELKIDEKTNEVESRRDATLCASNKGEATTKVAAENTNGVKLRSGAPFNKDAEKRYAGSNWEKHFDNETNFISGKYPSIKGMNGVEASSSASDSTLFGRFTARQASFMAAISGYDRRHLEVDEKRTAEETSQNSMCITNTTPIYPLLTRATAVVIPERTPPLYVLKGTVGGASPPTEKKALHAKLPYSRSNHRLFCPSRNGEMSPVAYEASSSLNLNAYKSEDKPKMDALCLDEIASANNYLRMSKRNKSGTLRLSIPTPPVTKHEHRVRQNAALPPKPHHDFRRRTMHVTMDILGCHSNSDRVNHSAAQCPPANANDSTQSPLLAQLRALASSTSSLVTRPPSNETSADVTRRQRPKSYVMATSSSSPLAASDASVVTATRSPHATAVQSSSTFETSTCLPGAASVSRTYQKNAFGVHHQPTTHRIQRFITFFSSNDHQNKHSNSSVATTSSRSNAKQYLKRSTTTLNSSHVSSLFVPVKAKDVRKQGQLIHQETALGESSKYDRRRWEQCWAVLHTYNLYLCRQLSSYVSDETQEKILNIPADSRTIDVRSAIVDIAYELLQRKDEQRAHVLRVVTQRRTEHLLQTESESEMLKWIDNIRSASTASSVPPVDDTYDTHCVRATKANSADSIFLEKRVESEGSESTGLRGDPDSLPCEGLSPSSSSRSDLVAVCNGRETLSSSPTTATTELIMQRYKAKSTHLNSPSAGKRHHSTGEGSTGHNMLPGTSSSTNVSEGANTGNAQCDQNTGATTPKSARKWKKSKAMKQGSSSSGRSDKCSVQSTSALGQKIVDCPTSGEGDQVPLLIQMCVQVVESYGLDTVGIYRIPGNTAAVNALKENLNYGFENVDFTDARWRDVNVVSSLLKMFLRKLPEPLLTDKLYPFFIDANRIAAHPQRLHKLRNLARKLPSAHYATLKYLIAHLRAVVAHSSVNKMETRNLALMFGPSIVRPSDDNMATMVTHMSDQCKIIETFITYYDWMFDEAGTADDEVPEPVPSACDAAVAAHSQGGSSGGLGVEAELLASGSLMTTSFNDMHNLLRRANEAEAVAMMDAQRGGKIKQMLNVRRNSKKDKSKKRERDHSAHAGTTPRVGSTAASAIAHPSSTTPVERAFCGTYQERDIDAEIASRRQRAATSASVATSSSVEHSPSVDSSLGSMVDSSARHAETQNVSVVNTQTPTTDVDAMRRKRQQDMYSARRIFIAGTDADLGEDGGLSQLDLEDLVSHTRHLNLASSPALEVLSAETREKIRRLQQLQGWLPAGSEKKSCETLNNKQGNKRTSHEEVKTPTTKTAEEFSSTDALSLTSDYSTTSSAALTVPVTVSCMDQLAATSSDYASSDVSPCARNPSVSPRNPVEQDAVEVIQLSSSPRAIGVHIRNNNLPETETEERKLETGSASKNCAVLPPRERRLSDSYNKLASETHVMFSVQEEDTSSSSSSSLSKDAGNMRVRAKTNSRKDPWRRHTISDVDLIRQALAEEAARKEKAPSAASPHIDKSSSKVGKFARWIKNSFRRSSPDLNIESVHEIGPAPSGASPPSGISSHVPTPPSEILPSSGDEQL